MNLSVTEQERLLETVHEKLLAFIYDELSGIPAIRQRLQGEGLQLNIGIEIGIAAAQTSLASLGDSGSGSTEEALDEWCKMGILLKDLREVAQTETRRKEEAVKALVEQIREISSTLSTRGRNYSWGWMHLHYPEIGLGKNPATVADERFASLSIPAYWQEIVETALRAISVRRDQKEVLSRFLTTLRFAKSNT